MGNKGLKRAQDHSVEMTVNKFDSILFCCLKILGYKTHPKITTGLELSSKKIQYFHIIFIHKNKLF